MAHENYLPKGMSIISYEEICKNLRKDISSPLEFEIELLNQNIKRINRKPKAFVIDNVNSQEEYEKAVKIHRDWYYNVYLPNKGTLFSKTNLL